MAAPPPVPPVPDLDRYQAYAGPAADTATVTVNFPVYGGQEDITVRVGGSVLSVSSWAFVSGSGTPLAQLPLPITDGVIIFTPLIPANSGTIEVIGSFQDRQTSMPTAPGLGRREFNQVVGGMTSSLREKLRAVRGAIQATDVALNPLPLAAARAGQGLFFDASGQPIMGQPAAAPVSSYSQTLVALTSEAAWQAALGINAQSIPTSCLLWALDHGVVGDGVANDAAAINAFLTLCAGLGAIAYFPGGKIYKLGGSTITVPDNSRVLCGPGAIFRRTADPVAGYGVYTTAMIVMGNRCYWSGGTLDNSTVIGTSATSITISNAQITLTTQTGLPLSTSSGFNFVRVYSRANPANAFEGAVTSYNSGTGVLVVGTPTFPQGAGTFSDWNINIGNVYQAPVAFHGVTRSTMEDVRVTGNWYTGFLFDGWNPPGGGALLCNNCQLIRCIAESVQNRGVSIYGNNADHLIDGCMFLGNSITNYAVNLNAANGSGNANAISGCQIVSCKALNVGFQGFEIGDGSFYNLIENCEVRGIVSTTGIAFLLQTANQATEIPQYNEVSGCLALASAGYGYAVIGGFYDWFDGCDAISCATGFLISSSTYAGPITVSSQYIGMSGCRALSCTGQGIEVGGVTPIRCDILNFQALNNGGVGVQIDAGAQITQVTGRSFGNGTNLLDNGNATNHANLMTT